MEKKFSTPKSTRTALAAITSEKFDALQAVGGWRGICESIIPTLIFLILYIFTHRPALAAFISCGICLIGVLVRILQRISIMPVLGGLLAVVISAVLVWHTGEASNMFLWGILMNAGYFFLLLLSLLIKWPLLGVVIGFFRGESTAWRKGEAWAQLRRRYYAITLIWLGVFALRLVVQLPLYWQGAAEALGVAKLILGIPLFALAAWFSWMLVRGVPSEKSAGEHPKNL